MALVILGLTPFLIALAVPAGLAWQEAMGRPGWRAVIPALVLGTAAAAAAAIAAAQAVSAGSGIHGGGAALRAALLVGSVGLLAAALYAGARAVGAPPAAGQALAALVAALLVATPFYMNPVVEGADPSCRASWVGLAAGANPFLVLLHAAGFDPLRADILYGVSVCQFYSYAYPSAEALAGCCLAAAAVLGAVAFGFRALRGGRMGFKFQVPSS